MSAHRPRAAADITRQSFNGLASVAWVDPRSDPWSTEALCVEVDPEIFFPEKGGSTREAKRICGLCDVKDDCLDAALAREERFGIWGGYSERERRRIKRGLDPHQREEAV